MAKVKPKQLPQKEFYKLLDELYSIITLLESKEEVKNFFKDLLSASEALMLARRIQIAKMLMAGLSYCEISNEIGTSFATIGSVQRWIDGGWGGYFKALENLRKKISAKEAESAKYYNDPFSQIKRRYPAHFFISNAIDDLKKWHEARQARKKKKDF
ncbi:MAG: hypothetical protein A2746_02120 [Candidatus Yanofskybacteria bacterium RIFCSPHIGHO2_01_FULL_44_22]|uniref:TrpR like protein, YerC/YecD n=1 Tax=Candidatus Yanofskybacteria bacterium RIFCSPHIGHO2_01_FULL_44_22 TaxID=1802669 RepID=A0A1F8EUE6_9BACT|nr:MAG: hypothetical protein A2746_02120 [Candidatus Yanofskybacteria bacterium RIFCSPHIGHO2_01_FULL_44_22]